MTVLQTGMFLLSIQELVAFLAMIYLFVKLQPDSIANVLVKIVLALAILVDFFAMWSLVDMHI